MIPSIDRNMNIPPVASTTDTVSTTTALSTTSTQMDTVDEVAQDTLGGDFKRPRSGQQRDRDYTLITHLPVFPNLRILHCG